MIEVCFNFWKQWSSIVDENNAVFAFWNNNNGRDHEIVKEVPESALLICPSFCAYFLNEYHWRIELLIRNVHKEFNASYSTSLFLAIYLSNNAKNYLIRYAALFCVQQSRIW